MELWNEKMIFVKNQPYLFRQNVPINPIIYQYHYLLQKLQQIRLFFWSGLLTTTIFFKFYDAWLVFGSLKAHFFVVSVVYPRNQITTLALSHIIDLPKSF